MQSVCVLMLNPLRGRRYFYAHFTDEDVEAQKGQISLLRSHGQGLSEPGFGPSSLWFQSPRLQLLHLPTPVTSVSSGYKGLTSPKSRCC